ncbi:hypothetical protein AAFG22_14730 [Bradyrhizobium sp. B024]|uniref:hypothetical protein n=1 Tax=Bradyrhizobium sp. B024 TaxID=3140247 RepID=UPI0031844CE2
MPIELADYTKPIRDALKRGKFCCVYVAAIEAPALCRIGYAEDLSAAVTRLQRTLPSRVAVESVLWVPDKGIAMTISKAIQCDLAAHLRPGGWFLLAADLATVALQMAAVRIYPGATLVWHDQLIEQLQTRRVA